MKERERKRENDNEVRDILRRRIVGRGCVKEEEDPPIIPWLKDRPNTDFVKAEVVKIPDTFTIYHKFYEKRFLWISFF